MRSEEQPCLRPQGIYARCCGFDGDQICLLKQVAPETRNKPGEGERSLPTPSPSSQSLVSDLHPNPNGALGLVIFNHLLPLRNVTILS